MLEAVIDDLSSIDGVEVARWNDSAGETANILGRRAAAFDAVLVIAPETDGILIRLCEAVEKGGGKLLGPSSPSVRLTADKLSLARHFAKMGIRTPVSQDLQENDIDFPLICKPRDGAGSQATFLASNSSELQRCIEQARAEGFGGKMIVQRFVPGVAASVAFILGPERSIALLPCRQLLSLDGRFHFLGCEAPLPRELATRAITLGMRAVKSIAGLHGYVGVDLVLGGPADGSEDHVIEINPRLTTSYLLLRQLAETNLMGILLRVLQGESATLSWKSEPMTFHL